MNDGGMGSLQFRADCPKDSIFVNVVSEAEFIDSDGTLVSIALMLDGDNQLFELDIWKVDFSPLITLPAVNQLKFA